MFIVSAWGKRNSWNKCSSLGLNEVPRTSSFGPSFYLDLKLCWWYAKPDGKKKKKKKLIVRDYSKVRPPNKQKPQPPMNSLKFNYVVFSLFVYETNKKRRGSESLPNWTWEGHTCGVWACGRRLRKSISVGRVCDPPVRLLQSERVELEDPSSHPITGPYNVSPKQLHPSNSVGPALSLPPLI